MKSIVITITGDAAIIDPALDAFAKQHGWTLESEKTQEDYARDVLLRFIVETVSAYNSCQAAMAASQQAASQTQEALYNTVMTLSVDG